MGKVIGLDKLLSKLSSLGGNVEHTGYIAVIRACKKIQRDAKYRCPVKTGQLRNSIRTRGEIKENEIVGQVYTNCEHAAYVEFGTGQKGMASSMIRPEGISYRADWKGMSAQPYLTPAFLYAKNTGESQQIMQEVILNEMRRLGGK